MTNIIDNRKKKEYAERIRLRYGVSEEEAAWQMRCIKEKCFRTAMLEMESHKQYIISFELTTQRINDFTVELTAKVSLNCME